MIPKGSRVVATYIYDNPHSKYVKGITVYATGDMHTGDYDMLFFYRDTETKDFPFDPIDKKPSPHPSEGENLCLSFEELGMYYECFVDINGPDVLKFALTETDLQRCMRDGL
jgi:hypothetical protein